MVLASADSPLSAEQWRNAPRVHVFDANGCFDFNFVSHRQHIFGFVSKKGIKLDDSSSYDFYFVKSGLHVFGYEQPLTEGDKISSTGMDALKDDNTPSVEELLTENFKLEEDFDVKSGKCFDYNFVQGGVNCFGMFQLGGISLTKKTLLSFSR